MMAAQVLAFISRIRAFLNSTLMVGVNMSPSLAPARATRILFARARIALDLSSGSSVTVRAQSFLQLAAKLEIVPDARAEVSHDVTPHLHPDIRSFGSDSS